MGEKQFYSRLANVGCVFYAAVTILIISVAILVVDNANQSADAARLATQWFLSNLVETEIQIVAGPTQTAFWATAGPKATQTAAQIELQEQATRIKAGPTQTHFWQTAAVFRGPDATNTAEMATKFRLATEILGNATKTAVMVRTSTAVALGTLIP